MNKISYLDETAFSTNTFISTHIINYTSSVAQFIVGYGIMLRCKFEIWVCVAKLIDLLLGKPFHNVVSLSSGFLPIFPSELERNE
jgi:hypothetical protein